MYQIQWTQNTKTLFFLSILLFLEGYLFLNFLPAIAGASILLFLVYSKMSFQWELGDIQAERTILENILYVNHPCHIKTTIHYNGGRAYLTVTDEIPQHAEILKGENSASKIIQPGEHITLSYQLSFSSRGSHQFTTLSYTLSDRWQLFTIQQTKPLYKEVLVHSDPAEIKKAKHAPHIEENLLNLPSLVGSEITRELEGIRPYLPGDLVRDIDWKASSRLQQLLTKHFQKRENLETVLLLDCTRSMRQTSGKYAKFEHAIAIGIQLTYILQSLHYHVGFIAFDEFKILSQLPPTSDHHRLYNELINLPTLKPIPAYTPKTTSNEKSNTRRISKEHQQFLSTITPFLSGKTTTSIKHYLEATGVYQAVLALLLQGKRKHLIFLTDLETNRDAFYAAVSLAHTRQHKIWVLTFFTPSYHLSREQLSTEDIENLYLYQISREKLIQKLMKKDIEIVELQPTYEIPRILQVIRRKQK